MTTLNLTPEEARLIIDALHAIVPGGGRTDVSRLLAKLETETGIDRDNQRSWAMLQDADLVHTPE